MSRPRPNTVGGRLFASHLAITLAMAAAIVLAGVLVGPPTFHEHMVQAGHGHQPLILAHAEEAFTVAGLLSLTVGLGVALAGAIAASLFATSRIAGTLHRLTSAANTVAGGDYDTVIPLPGAGAELDRLAASFNAMAAQLATTEATRQRLLTDVGHELKTPLATLKVLAEGLEDGVVAPTPETWVAIQHQVDRLDRLATDIRDVSTAAEGRVTLRLQPVDLSALAAAAHARFTPAFTAKDVRLELVTDHATIVHGDPDRLDQVLTNLLGNALRHTPARGKVTIGVARAGDTAVLTVTDTGDGIATADLPHVFERFFRADKSRADRRDGGTGVGLTISRAIAHAHEGSLTAASAGPGAGATFRLALAAAPPTTPSNLHRSRPDRRPTVADTGHRTVREEPR